MAAKQYEDGPTNFAGETIIHAAWMLAYAMHRLLDSRPTLLDSYIPGFVDLRDDELVLADCRPADAFKSKRAVKNLKAVLGGLDQWNNLIDQNSAMQQRDSQLGSGELLYFTPIGEIQGNNLLPFLIRRADVAWTTQRLGWPTNRYFREICMTYQSDGCRMCASPDQPHRYFTTSPLSMS